VDRFTAQVERLAVLRKAMEVSIETAGGFAAELRAQNKDTVRLQKAADELQRVLVLWKAEREDKPLCRTCKGSGQCVGCGGSGNVSRGTHAEITCDVCNGDRGCTNCLAVVAAQWEDML
jgi:hypothetical protein